MRRTVREDLMQNIIDEQRAEIARLKSKAAKVYLWQITVSKNGKVIGCDEFNATIDEARTTFDWRVKEIECASGLPYDAVRIYCPDCDTQFSNEKD